MNSMSQVVKTVDAQGVALNADMSQGPYLIDGCDTIAKLFRQRCQELSSRTVHREKKLGIWTAYSWADFWEKSRLIGLGLHRLGFRRGEVISILSEDNKEWLYIDMGAQCMGGIVSGIYTTDSAAQLAYLVNDSSTRFLFVENDEQLDKFLEVRDQMPSLVKAVVLDRDGLHGFEHDDVLFLDDLYALGAEALAANPDLFDQEVSKGTADETSILVYTSGTTGPPKGAMIGADNIMCSVSTLLLTTEMYPDDEQICFLPLCHVLERLFSGMAPIASKVIINFAESPETVFENVQEISPHSMIGVPRIWEKMYSKVRLLLGDATGFQRWAYQRAFIAGEKRAEAILGERPLPTGANLAYRFWDFTVLSNMRHTLGLNRIRRAGSGAAPISPDLLKWFLSIGVPIYEGYGMTESGGVISINFDGKNKLGSVGPPVPGGQVRIAEDGEIQYRGGTVFQGYWRNDEKTAETFTEDGWLRTGDVGSVDSDGFLTVSGRLKDIIITAGGKNITPAEIENQLKFSPYVSDAIVIGDKRKFLTCLIMIDQDNVEKFAQDKRVPFSDFRSLCAAPEVVDLIRTEVDDANQQFARVEQLKDFRLIDVLLTAEDDEVTPTMKLKRSFVEKKHAALIDTMYR